MKCKWCGNTGHRRCLICFGEDEHCEHCHGMGKVKCRICHWHRKQDPSTGRRRTLNEYMNLKMPDSLDVFAYQEKAGKWVPLVTIIRAGVAQTIFVFTKDERFDTHNEALAVAYMAAENFVRSLHPDYQWQHIDRSN